MKAVIDIDLRNVNSFSKGILKEGKQSYFTVKAGENLAEVMKLNSYTKEEIAESETRIIKGNPQWVTLENEVEEKKAVEVKSDKVSYEKRYEELKSEKKEYQVKMLKDLGADKIPAYEDDRVKMIIKLEKK